MKSDISKTKFKSTEVQTMGSDAACDVVLPVRPEVAGKHALIKRSGDRIFIRDLGSPQGTFLDGKRLPPDHWFEITRYDTLALGALPLKLGKLLFSNTDRVGLKTAPIHYRSRSGRVLCAGAYITASPGTVTAIMGPSGSGKTVFMNHLAGYLSDETVLNSGAHARLIGYAEQFEALHADLTVGQSLDYRLRLRFPDMEKRVRRKLIENTCRELGLGQDNLEKFLGRQIGQPGTMLGGLSGGERRRVHIAHELVLQPLALLLDEPTSGLSSHDAESILKLLRSIAADLGITVVLSMHQPNAEQLRCIDDVLLFAHGGKPAYYGSLVNLVPDLSRLTQLLPQKDENAGDYALRLLGDKIASEQLSGQFVKNAEQKLNTAEKPGSTLTLNQTAGSRLKRVWHILNILVRRSWQMVLNNRQYQYVAGIMPICLGCLILAAFSGYQSDNRTMDRYLRTLSYFQELRAPYEKEGLSVPVDKLWSQADTLGGMPNAKATHITAATAHQRASVYFLLVSAVIWFGVMSGCREIVEERLSLQRELRSGLSSPAGYLVAKVVVLMSVVSLQTVILTSITVPFMFKAGLNQCLNFSLALLPTAFGAVSVGLLVSAACETLKTALTSVPLVLLPQLLLGGILRPPGTTQMDWIGQFQAFLSGFTLQRWGFESMLRMDSFAHNQIITQSFTPEADGRYGKLAIIGVRETGIVSLLFGDGSSVASITMACFTIGFVTLLCARLLILRKKG